MAVHSCCVVEFLGGPLDGHTEVKEAPFAPYIGVRTIVARRRPSRLRRMLHKVWGPWGTRERMGLVPLAVYEVDNNGRQPCYRYVATQAVRQECLDSGHGRLAVLVRFTAAST